MRQKKTSNICTQNQSYIEQAVANLKQNPAKLRILRENCELLAQQYSMNKGLLRAIERVEWVFCVDDDIERICKQILDNDYIGNKIRRYPLLFKGI